MANQYVQLPSDASNTGKKVQTFENTVGSNLVLAHANVLVNSAGVEIAPLTDTQLRASALSVTGAFFQATQPVSGTFWQATQPVSGTFWQATQPVSGPLTDAQLRATAVPVSGTFWQATQPVSGTFFQATQPISAVALPLPTGAAVASKQPVIGVAGTASSDVLTVQGIASMVALKVDGSGVTQPVSGTVAVSNFPGSQAVTGTFWQATQPVSAAALPLPAGASTEATLALIKAKTDNIDVLLSTRTKAADQQHVIVDSSSSVAVTGSFFQATQPISAAALPLPAGASTAAKQPALGTAGTASTDVLTIQGIASMVALKVDGSGVTQPVSGTVTANAGTGTMAVSGPATDAQMRASPIPVSGTVALGAGAAAIGTVAAPAITKGTQAATGFSTQDLKDSGRVNICWTLSRTAATAVAEALITLTESRDGAATSTFTSKVVTSGKRLRITSITISAEAGGTTPAISRQVVRLRFNTAGAVTTASPLQWVSTVSTPATAKSVVNLFEDFPDGMEYLGDGTKQIGITWESTDWITTTNIPALTLTVFGFEY